MGRTGEGVVGREVAGLGMGCSVGVLRAVLPTHMDDIQLSFDVKSW